MTTLTKVRKMGDLVIYMDSLEYCIFPAILRNGTGATVALTLSNMFGQYLIAGTNGADFNLALNANVASVIAILIDGPEESKATANNYTGKYRVLKNVPNIVNLSRLPVNDVAGTAWTHATGVAALKVLGFEFRSEGTKQTIQTT